MSVIARLLTSLVIAAVAATATSLLMDSRVFNPLLLAAFSIATVLTALLTAANAPETDTAKTAKARTGSKKKRPASSAAAGGPRSEGTVKWFNMAKGFGFIVLPNGDEIFVHFRSIRGEGRRGLRDGQRVSFVVTQGDKGPQAEDVEALD